MTDKYALYMPYVCLIPHQDKAARGGGGVTQGSMVHPEAFTGVYHAPSCHPFLSFVLLRYRTMSLSPELFSAPAPISLSRKSGTTVPDLDRGLHSAPAHVHDIKEIFRCRREAKVRSMLLGVTAASVSRSSLGLAVLRPQQCSSRASKSTDILLVSCNPH